MGLKKLPKGSLSVRKCALPIAVFASITVVSISAAAQDAPAAPPGPTKQGTLVIKNEGESKRPPGFTPGLAIGAQFQVADSRAVVGQADGTSVTLGSAIDGVLEFNQGPHEWRSMVVAGVGVSRTPAVERFIKTRDSLEAETIYLYHVLPAFGPFGRVAMRTQMFSAYDVRATPTMYSIKTISGATDTLYGGNLELTDPFRPFSLKESLGAFVQPLTSDRIRLEIRAGLGAHQTLASGQLAVDDDDVTPVTEVVELDDSYQVGAEAVVNAWGTIDATKRVSYTVGLSVLVPFVTSDLVEGDERNNLDLTALELSAGLNVKLFEWASLDYKLAVTRLPLLVDATQISNNLLLTIGFGLGSKAPKPPPELPKCEPVPPVVAPAPAAAPPPAAAAAPAPAAVPAAAPAPAPAPAAVPAPAPENQPATEPKGAQP
jgi:hypothetical protein